MSLKRSRLDPGDFTVAWISALPLEFAAAEAMLDEEYEIYYKQPKYNLGRVGSHNIVLVCLPAGQTGTISANAVVMELRHIFTSIQFGLLVGIGGGVPSNEADI